MVKPLVVHVASTSFKMYTSSVLNILRVGMHRCKPEERYWAIGGVMGDGRGATVGLIGRKRIDEIVATKLPCTVRVHISWEQ